MGATSVYVTVTCPNCGDTREVTARHARRETLCRRCINPPPSHPVTDATRRYWLERYTDREIAQIAGELMGREVPVSVIHARRQKLLPAKKTA
jgi:NMD protein affecting ribosome stability and mRNA decay